LYQAYLFAATAARLANEHTEDTITKYPTTWQRLSGKTLKPLILFGMILGRQMLVTLKTRW